VGLLPAFCSDVKNKHRNKAGKETSQAELRALEQELDLIYAQMRERAHYEWSLRQGKEKDPADASVSVRVTAASELPEQPPPAEHKPAPRLLLPKHSKPRRRITPANRRRA
jgi:hypothetical protein